jgi:hypothetical protein
MTDKMPGVKEDSTSAWLSSLRDSAYRTPEKELVVLVVKKSVY